MTNKIKEFSIQILFFYQKEKVKINLGVNTVFFTVLHLYRSEPSLYNIKLCHIKKI